MIADDARERRIDLAAGAGLKDMDFEPDDASRRFHISHRGLGTRSICRVDKHGDLSGRGHQLAQEPQPLGRQLCREKTDTCRVPARSGEAGNEAELHRVAAGGEDDRNGRGGSLGCKRRRREGRSDHGHVTVNKLCYQLRKAIVPTGCRAELDQGVLASNITGLGKAAIERGEKM